MNMHSYCEQFPQFLYVSDTGKDRNICRRTRKLSVNSFSGDKALIFMSQIRFHILMCFKPLFTYTREEKL